MRFATAALALALFAVPAAAQTTGFAGINDYTVNGFTSGSTSCNFVLVPVGSPITFTVTAAPGSPVLILFVFDCPCTPNVVIFPNCGPPLVFPSTSLDLLYSFPGCPSFAVFGFSSLFCLWVGSANTPLGPPIPQTSS